MAAVHAKRYTFADRSTADRRSGSELGGAVLFIDCEAIVTDEPGFSDCDRLVAPGNGRLARDTTYSIPGNQ